MANNIITDKENRMELDYVTKRDGTKEEIQFDKILRRIKKLSEGLTINPSKVTQKVCSQIYPNIHTSEIDELAGQICASLSTEHPDYGLLASKIVVSNHPIDTVSTLTSDFDLLILGTPRKDTLRTMLFGTGKDKFAVKATCSVLRLTLKQ